jgi:AraC-like DNA-binding protein
MIFSRAPNALLQPFVELIWAADGFETLPEGSGRELVLPTGKLHIVFRIDGPPLRLFRDAADVQGQFVGSSLIGGARAGPYIRDISIPCESVGAMLRPGAAALLIGAPANHFSHAHTLLEDVWGRRAVAEIGQRLSEARSASRRLDLLEDALAMRVPEKHGIDPRIALALARFGTPCCVADVVRESGLSHRYFTKLFRECVGLDPKIYCRILRFGRALERLAGDRGLALADLALEENYADQPHLSREFREFAGLSPGLYRFIGPPSPRHVQIE